MQPQGRGPEHGHLPVQVSLCRLKLLVGRRPGGNPELLSAGALMSVHKQIQDNDTGATP